jgi:Fic-DOC domain mobile mystery protein B
MSATGKTVFDADGLIPKDLVTQQELNEWEQQNILAAQEWAFKARVLARTDPLDDRYLRKLHKRMFDKTWEWAGDYRTTNVNMGCDYTQIRQNVVALLDDVQSWLKHQTYDIDEAAVRYHHRLVWRIHAFRNGNGRHSRMIADVLVVKHRRPPFTWGPAAADLSDVSGSVRKTYFDALHALDANDNDIRPLLEFARS